MTSPRPVIQAIGPLTDPGSLVSALFSGIPIGARGRYDVEVQLADRMGVWECVGLTVRSPERTDRARIDGGVLRGVRVAELVGSAAGELERSGYATRLAQARVPGRLEEPLGYVDRWTGEFVAPSMTHDEHVAAMARREREVVDPARAAAQRWRRMVREAARAGGRTRLEAAAVIYRRAARRANPKPTKAVQEELGITHDAAVGLVRRCRAAGLLPKTRPGVANARRPGGSPPQASEEGS